MRIADDFAAIRERLAELRRERELIDRGLIPFASGEMEEPVTKVYLIAWDEELREEASYSD